MSKIFKPSKGSILVVTLVITELFLVLTLGSISLILLEQRLYISKIAKEQALQIAEAGVNYYRWVLYHDHDEYCKGLAPCNTAPYTEGPFQFTDNSGTITGSYLLHITPPALNGSTIVTIRSEGWVNSYPSIRRNIEVRCGIPSWTTYSVLADDFMRFGAGTEVWGPIHSNLGIRFDGIAHHLISSYQLDYDDPDHAGANEFGVHTHVAPVDPLPDGGNPPGNVPERNDVFIAGRNFPVGNISFSLLDNYTYSAYGLATSSGLVFDGTSTNPYAVSDFLGCTAAGTCDQGFHITIRTDDKFDIRGVTDVYPDCNGSESNSISAEDAAVRTYNIPANGIIFVKDRVWIDGHASGSRVNILAFKDPFVSGTADINFNNDLLYTYYDGTDSIGLIAQRNINAGQYSEDDLRIDAALIARDGRIGRNNYSGCTYNNRSILTLFGALATSKRYGFAYVNSSTGAHVSGYFTRNLIYDNNLTFSPPPHYPTTGEYTFISWEEK